VSQRHQGRCDPGHAPRHVVRPGAWKSGPLPGYGVPAGKDALPEDKDAAQMQAWSDFTQMRTHAKTLTIEPYVSAWQSDYFNSRPPVWGTCRSETAA